MRIAAIGLLVEALAIGIAYSQFRVLGRVAVYSAFYTWPIDLLIEPLLSAAGLSNRGAFFAVMIVILFLLNSLKWIGLLFLRQSRNATIATILLALLAFSVLLSFSLKSL
jgi:hypothetical protein